MKWLLKPPGVYRPQADTWLLADSLRTAGIPPGGRVLDVGTGTGALAVTAARAGAGEVVAVDLSSRAVLAARLNTAIRGLPVRVRRGDVLAGLGAERFDLILANPPYVPADAGPAPRHRKARNWDAGSEGRALLDPLCEAAASALAPDGTLLLVQSSLSGVDATLERLRGGNLKVSIVARRREPFGPVLRTRRAALEARGLIEPGQRDEELVVIRADHVVDR